MERRSTSFLSLLFEKLAAVQKIANKTGVNTDAAIKEVDRQIAQVSSKRGDNPITGEGVTKSGPED